MLIIGGYMEGKMEVDPMNTHRPPLERIRKVFDLMCAGHSIRGGIVC